MAEALVNDAPVALAAAITSTQTTVTRASATTGWPGDSNGPASANFRLNVSDGTNQELMLVTGGQGTTTLTVTRAVEPIGTAGSPATAYAFGTNATMTPTVTAAGFFAAQPASYDETVLTKLSLAPVAYWKLNDPVGSTTAADSSGNGYTLAATGTVTFGGPSVVPSDSETSCSADGSTGLLSTSTVPAKLPTGGAPFSLILAARYPGNTPGVGNFGTVVGNGVFGTAGVGYMAMPSANANDMLTLTVAPGSASVTAPLSPQNCLIGAVYDGSVAALYLNGALLVATGHMATTWAAGNVNLFGNVGNNFPTGYPIGRVAIFAGVLSMRDWALLTQAFTGV